VTATTAEMSATTAKMSATTAEMRRGMSATTAASAATGFTCRLRSQCGPRCQAERQTDRAKGCRNFPACKV